MKIIITGATGTAGSEALRQAFLDPDVVEVLVLARRAPDITDPKLKVTLLADFTDYAAIAPQLAGYDACLWCLGVSQNDVSKDQYAIITYDYALAAARAMGAANADFRFCFLSGAGADTAEKSRILFARIKGKTENALTRLGHPKAWHFRPGYIHPVNTLPKRWFERWLEPLTPLFYRFLPAHIISTVELAKAMLVVAKHGSSQTIFDNGAIRELSKRT
jgi:uncharacterized protein YbjT (DUF2867 family)